jgi:phosphatidylinositol glycan class S
VPLGRTKSSFNYSLDDKRVLNFENVVNDDDNIKQDISIDVYGRAEKEEEANGATTADKEDTEKASGFCDS